MPKINIYKPILVEQETAPTDTTKNNPTVTLNITDGKLESITKVIAGVTYQKPVTYDGENITFGSWEAV